MSQENSEVKQPVRNLERVNEKSFRSYEAANSARQVIIAADGPAPAKVKIFARQDGTFDLVTYQKIQVKVVKVAEKQVGDEQVATFKRVPKHGQTAKQRRADAKK